MSYNLAWELEWDEEGPLTASAPLTIEFHGDKGTPGYELLHPSKGKTTAAVQPSLLTIEFHGQKGDPDYPHTDVARIKDIVKELRGDCGQLGICLHASRVIEKEFGYPVVKGIYGGHTLHSWNVLPDGSILDSTADQFQDGGEPVRVLPKAAPEYREFTDKEKAFIKRYEEEEGHHPDLFDLSFIDEYEDETLDSDDDRTTVVASTIMEFHLPGEHPQKTHGRRFSHGNVGRERHIDLLGDDSKQIGRLNYFLPTKNAKDQRIKMGSIWVDQDHRKQGHAGSLMSELAKTHPGFEVDPGDFTEAGRAWWNPPTKGHRFGKAPITLLTEHPALTEIISRFRKNNIPLYVVGGPVRDLLSEGHPGLDLDMTTPADVPTIKRLIDDLGALAPAGEDFGTVKLIRTLPDGARWEIEITQHRGEVYDTDSRKPTVAPTQDLSKDLGRRDFTLNSLALNTATGEIIDQHGGIADLRNAVLRTPLDPEKTFSDDPLRILRLVRFSSTRGMKADEATHEAARKVAPRMSIVSPERRLVELQKILKSPRPEALTDSLRMSHSLGLDDHLFSGFNLTGPRSVDLTGVGPRARLAALTFTTPDVKKALFNLKVKNETIKHVTAVHAAVAKLTNSPELAVRKHSDAEVRDALELMRAYGRPISHKLDDVIQNASTFRKPLPVTGLDAPDSIKGKAIGEWLARVEAAFLRDPSLTKEAAIALA